MKLMRDSFLEIIYDRMKKEEDIFILSDDMGAPVLDKIRSEYADRFINVGIAEQNLIGVAAGLSSEGYKVICYGIIPFFIRALEQIRVDLVIKNISTPLNVALVGVGAGLSYGVSGPTHHAIEDLSLFRSLPGIDIFSPSDYLVSEVIANNLFKEKAISYIRFDGEKDNSFYKNKNEINFDYGFNIIKKGAKGVLISTGTMVKRLVSMADKYNVGLVDVFRIENLDIKQLKKVVLDYDFVVTVQEGFIGRGGFDSMINHLLLNEIVLYHYGFKNTYSFYIGERTEIFKQMGLDFNEIELMIKKELQ